MQTSHSLASPVSVSGRVVRLASTISRKCGKSADARGRTYAQHEIHTRRVRTTAVHLIDTLHGVACQVCRDERARARRVNGSARSRQTKGERDSTYERPVGTPEEGVGTCHECIGCEHGHLAPHQPHVNASMRWGQIIERCACATFNRAMHGIKRAIQDVPRLWVKHARFAGRQSVHCGRKFEHVFHIRRQRNIRPKLAWFALFAAEVHVIIPAIERGDVRGITRRG